MKKFMSERVKRFRKLFKAYRLEDKRYSKKRAAQAMKHTLFLAVLMMSLSGCEEKQPAPYSRSTMYLRERTPQDKAFWLWLHYSHLRLEAHSNQDSFLKYRWKMEAIEEYESVLKQTIKDTLFPDGTFVLDRHPYPFTDTTKAAK